MEGDGRRYWEEEGKSAFELLRIADLQYATFFRART